MPYHATFNRNFRKAFDITPGEARAQVVGGAGMIVPASTADLKRQQTQREHHQWFHSIGI